MSRYSEFKLTLLSQGLDPKLADPILYAPKLLDTYNWTKLTVALSIFQPSFTPKLVTVALRPKVHDIIKFQAFASNTSITAHINKTLANSMPDILEVEITESIVAIFNRMIA